MAKPSPIDVLICGAGAAGLTLAIDLARRGVAFRLIDKQPRPFVGSRGKAIQPRTQEVFDDLGIIDRVAGAGGRYPPQRTYRADGSYAETQGFAPVEPTAQEPYGTALLVPQWRTETIMRERLAEFGHRPEYGRELLAFEQDAEAVTATVDGPEGVEAVHCRYLVGGDGGRSSIRQALGIAFPGKTLGVRAIVADLVLDGLTRDAWHRFGEEAGNPPLSFCPLPHGDVIQLQAPIPLEGDMDLSAAGIQAFIDARRPGGGLIVRDVVWASAYGMNARLADRYRVGRVLLMGDAAHIHPPTGGQGLNTSVQDAYNLGWKLAAVLSGAPGGLLESYEAERRPIAAAMLGLATELLDKAKQGEMTRGRDVHQLDLGYPSSRLSHEGAKRQGGVRAGDRAPDGLLTGAGGQPKRLFDLFRGPHWTMIARNAYAESLPGARPGLRIHRLAEAGEFHDEADILGQVYGMIDGDLLFVRPDGYVGAIIPVTETESISVYLAGVGLG